MYTVWHKYHQRPLCVMLICILTTRRLLAKASDDKTGPIFVSLMYDLSWHAYLLILFIRVGFFYYCNKFQVLSAFLDRHFACKVRWFFLLRNISSCRATVLAPHPVVFLIPGTGTVSKKYRYWKTFKDLISCYMNNTGCEIFNLPFQNALK